MDPTHLHHHHHHHHHHTFDSAFVLGLLGLTLLSAFALLRDCSSVLANLPHR